MTEVIGVRFREEGKVYYFNPNGVAVECGTDVIVETSRGIEYGVCVSSNEMIDDALVVQPLRPMLRIATEEDRRQWEENKKKEAEAFAICENKILEHGLVMKLVEVEYTLDGGKILFFFTSEGRVDFRDLVKELASIFRTRIELRQIGVRDEAKMLGGLGICGRPFCCSTFLDEFQPVSIKMAKTQNLSLNPTKISGTCGRLMCCLKYEQESYERLIANSVKPESYVKTSDGKGTVVDVNLFKGTVKVRIEGDNDLSNVKTYKSSQIVILRDGKKGPMLEEPEFMPETEPEPEFMLPDLVPELSPENTGPSEPQAEQQTKKPYNRRRKKGKGPAATKENQQGNSSNQQEKRPADNEKKVEGSRERQPDTKNMKSAGQKDQEQDKKKKSGRSRPGQRSRRGKSKKSGGTPGNANRQGPAEQKDPE
ncbi:MAG: hypothetical protein GXX89_01060 [Clostridiales bacterium]|nr:hypothetical protein [Clostridiales bacterium]